MELTDLIKKKRNGEKIAMITAYDFTQATIAGEAGIDLILVGDSLSMVIDGNNSTLPVSMEIMQYHTNITVKGAKGVPVIADMPFLSYQANLSDAIKNAGSFLKLGARAVKIEGNLPELTRKLTSIGIPVMGHLGLTPQSVNQLGGYHLQGKDEKSAEKLILAAKQLEEAGAFSIVLEAVPSHVAKLITESISIPTIGIGAGIDCDGQVLVYHDLLGLFDEFKPKFVKRYANLKQIAVDAIKTYSTEVKTGKFPDDKHSWK